MFKIYHNNGDNTFTEQTSIALTGVSSGSVAWGDYDNDGDLDILLAGIQALTIYPRYTATIVLPQTHYPLSPSNLSSIYTGWLL